MPGVPIVDLAIEAGSRSETPTALVDAVGLACTEIGFFVVIGHGLEPVMDHMFGAARSLFALPERGKESLAMVERQGFVPAYHRRVDPTIHSAPMEYYDVGTEGTPRWPSRADLAGFDDIVRSYQRAVLITASDLLRVLAIGLDLEPGFFAERMRAPRCFLRMMHYEPRAPGAEGTPEVLTDPHTDYGLITLLATDGVGGLEVSDRSGSWRKVTAPAGSLVVNLGDMLARWTNDRYVSTPHRVIAPSGRDRYSVPFFVNPDPSAVVSCLPSCVDERHPCRYRPVTAGTFLARRIAEGGYMDGAATTS